VKADADAVFIPGRLQQRLSERNSDPDDKIFFLNCAAWKSLQGPLEVISRGAGKIFFATDGQDRCFAELEWENWGEDWFVSSCLEKLGAHSEAGYDLLDDQWCAHGSVDCRNEQKVAYHPFKKLDDFMHCRSQAQQSSANSDDLMTIRK